MYSKGKVLYIGGFELPDKNAAAQRVVGIANILKFLGYEVIFVNSIKNCYESRLMERIYFGFKCWEHPREDKLDYLISAKTVLKRIKEIKPQIIIAYNYPSIALDRIRKYCKNNNIKIYADVTEWYQPCTGNLYYNYIKKLDTTYRMKYVHKSLDGVIVISSYLYEYYKDVVKTTLIPPTVDITDEKWRKISRVDDGVIRFVYAGSPSAQKERLDLIITAIEEIPLTYKVVLNVVGITKEEFMDIYKYTKEISERIKFWGRVKHRKAIDVIKQSDWSIILRDDNKVVKAGFPTKLVESISCGTPVIVNDFSNIRDYLHKGNMVIIEKLTDINTMIKYALNCRGIVDNSTFDYHHYTKQLENMVTKQ